MPSDDHELQREWIRSVVERFEGRLVRYAMQMVGDVNLARDVVQDTFLKLCRESQAELEPRLAAWLYTVCRNRALDVIRKEKRMRTISEERANSQVSREESQDVLAERRDSAMYVLRIVEGLTENQREVVRLKFQSGLSYREISEVTQLSVTNVGYLLHTAVHKIREQVSAAEK